MELKILTIGNSFSICLGKNLPKIVASVPGNSLKLCSAYIGGCSLAMHHKNIEEAEKTPDFKPYQRDVWYSDPGKPQEQTKANIQDMLSEDRWDIVTIQQASHLSWDLSTYQPFADHVIAEIRKRQPQAKIAVQQTWAYRADDPRISREGSFQWGFDQDEMYRRLTENYIAFAGSRDLPLIPTGYAVQLTRQNEARHFSEIPYAEKAKLKWPDFPPQASDPVGRNYWFKDQNGELKLSEDAIHLNLRGEYLQSCLYFAYFYGVNTDQIPYEHPEIGHEDCIFLKKMAQRAMDEFPEIIQSKTRKSMVGKR